MNFLRTLWETLLEVLGCKKEEECFKWGEPDYDEVVNWNERKD